MAENKYYYDAFISYRHTELDIFVAESLHKLLERYRVPKRIQEKSGKKKISRIFRDRDELPLSADLAENIKQALRQSEYLIVICSPDAVQSEWVQREIEVFLETHSKKNVLTILVNGEPAEAFPEILCFDEKTVITESGEEMVVREMVEPLAADVRADSKQEVYKKLKQESLRILAPLLSCTYDDLKQRHKEYVMKRALAAAVVCTGLALLFTGYALYQNMQIQKQYDQALRNESQYLVERSAQLLAEGDREGALQLALEAAPSEEMDRPLIPEVMYALNNALYSYTNEGSIYFLADKMFKTDSRTQDNGKFSPAGTYYFCLDESGTAYFYDGISGEEVWKIRATDLNETNDPIFVDGYFLKSENAVLVTANQILIVNVAEQSVEKSIRTELGMESHNSVYGCETHVLLTRYEGISIFELESGTCVFDNENRAIDMMENIITAADWMEIPENEETAEEELWVLIGIGKRWESTLKQELLAISVTTGEIVRIASDEIAEVCALGDSKAATIEYTKEDYYADEKWYRVHIYDLITQERIWSSEEIYSYSPVFAHDLEAYELDAFGENEMHTVVVANVDDTLMLIEPYDQNEFVRVHYASQIAGVGQYDADRLLVGLKDGSIWIQTMNNETFSKDSGHIENEVVHFVYDRFKQSAVQTVSDSNKNVLSRMYEDESATKFVNDGRVSSFGYVVCDNKEMGTYKGYRLIVSGHELPNGDEEKQVILQDMDSDETLADMNIGVSFVQTINVFTKDGKDYFTFSHKPVGTMDIVFCTVDLTTGEEVYSVNGSELNLFTGNSSIIYGKDNDWGVYYYGSSFGIISMLTGEEILPCDQHMGEGYISQAEVLPDGRHIVFAINDYLNDDSVSIKVWDTEENKVVQTLMGDCLTAGINFASELAIGESENIMAIYVDKEVWIVDLLTGETLQKIPFYGSSFCKIGFINQDKYLLMYGDSRELMLWDLEKQEITMSSEVYFEGSIDITRDLTGKYFGIKETVLLSDKGVSYQPLHIFSIDEENGTFYQYADVTKSLACFEYEEICCTSLGGTYYYSKMKSLEELREQAEAILK